MPNTLSVVAPKLLAQGMMALRSMAVMPRLVNADYSAQAAQQGETITIPIPSAIAAQDVTPANVPPSTGDIAPTQATIDLDNWVEAPFYMDDNDLRKVVSGTLPMVASEAIKSIAERVNSDLLSNYTAFFGAVGTAGTTPFADISSAAELRRILNVQLAPMGDRRAVLDPIADAAATQLRAFNDTSYSGDDATIIEGMLGRKMGFDFFMDQQVPDHVAGTGSGYLVNGTPSVGDKTIPVDTGTGTLVVGDIITFAGHDQQYVVTTAYAGGAGNIAIEPGLVEAPANNAAITKVGDHVPNLGFHRDAIGFASRPLIDGEAAQLGSIIQSVVDPVSGLAMRLEITREHKRTRYSYDILYGHAVIRRELGARLLG